MMIFRKTAFYLLAMTMLFSMALTAEADDFAITDLSGKTHKLSQYKGKWVLVNFWATWCPPCQDEIPDLIALHGDSKNNVVVLGVALDFLGQEQVKNFAETMGVNYPVFMGSQKIASQIGPVDGLPTTYLYNPQGKMVAHQTGPVTKEAVLDFIKKNASKGK